MALYNIHRVLIAAAILFDVGYTYFAINRWRVNDSATDLYMAIGTTVIMIGFVVYLTRFNRKMKTMKKVLQRDPATPADTSTP